MSVSFKFCSNTSGRKKQITTKLRGLKFRSRFFWPSEMKRKTNQSRPKQLLLEIRRSIILLPMTKRGNENEAENERNKAKRQHHARHGSISVNGVGLACCGCGSPGCVAFNFYNVTKNYPSLSLTNSPSESVSGFEYLHLHLPHPWAPGELGCWSALHLLIACGCLRCC